MKLNNELDEDNQKLKTNIKDIYPPENLTICLLMLLSGETCIKH